MIGESFGDFSQLEHTRPVANLGRLHREAGERSALLEKRFSQFFSQLPEELSLQNPYRLAQQERDVFEHIQEELRDIYGRFQDVLLSSSDALLDIPSFDDLLRMESSDRKKAILYVNDCIEHVFYSFLSLRTLGKIQNFFRLFSAFAEVLVHAEALRNGSERSGEVT